MSFPAPLMADVKAADPNLPRGLTASGDWRLALHHMQHALRLGADFIS